MYKHHHSNYNNHPSPPLTPLPNHHRNNDYFYEDSNSEIYIDQTYNYGRGGNPVPPPPPPPRVSKMQQQQPTRPITPTTSIYNSQHLTRPHTTTPSEYSSVLSKSNKSTKNKGGVVIETMSAPNPCCPDSKGVCCILLLVNLGLLLVTLGFSIVLQLFEPPFVWYCGLLFLIVGFIALIVSLLFCMRICTFSRWYNNNSSPNSSIHGDGNGGGAKPSELYWTHHWQKRINLPGGGNTSRASS